jgi:FAD/FMN-containing dehydrogenase
MEKIFSYERVESDISDFTASISTINEYEDPMCIVYPLNTKEVQAVVKFAAKNQICLVPMSSGKSEKSSALSLPSIGVEAIIVNLSKMKKIVRIDKRNRIAMIEAGVTYKELIDAVAKEGLKLTHPLLPRDNKSVVADLLDRQPTMIPRHHWDVNDPLCCLEVVFGTGEVFRTGSAAGTGTLEEQWDSGVAQSNPMGPSHTDFGRVILGGQGTLGIITWATVKLEVAPSLRKLVFAQEEQVKQLQEVVYKGALRRLGDEYILLNNIALASMLETGSEKIMEFSNKQKKWTLISNVCGYSYFPKDKLDYQLNDLKDLSKKTNVNFELGISGVNNDRIYELLDATRGEKNWKSSLKETYLDVFFISTLDKVDKFTVITEKLVEKYGFKSNDIAIYVQPTMQGRNSHIEFIVPFDVSQKDKALVMYHEIVNELMNEGAFFNRPNDLISEAVYAKNENHVESLKKLKTLLDPHYILNRGKLCY